MPTPAEPVQLPRFTHAEAWQLGRDLVERCTAATLPVTISITLGSQRVFHCALPGTSADNDSWVARKTEIVRRFNRSSLMVYEDYARDNPDFYRVFALPEATFFAAGGAVPLAVGGAQVGVLAISGLDSTADHTLAMDAVAALAEAMAPAHALSTAAVA